MSNHKLRIHIDGDYVRADLICPDEGCEPATCQSCGRRAGSDDRCPACPVDTGCWLGSWTENVDILEYATGQCEFTVPVDCRWDGNEPVVEFKPLPTSQETTQ